MDVRWLWLIVVFVIACGGASQPPPVIAGQAPITGEVRRSNVTLGLDFDLDLVELPPVPEKRGLDLAGEATCRTLFERGDDLHRLIRVATLTGGDCQIDVDGMLGAYAPYRIGGCTGASVDEAVVAWKRVALVATTHGRLRAALNNVAQLSWYLAWSLSTPDAWADAGDAFVRASREDDALELASRAVDAYENALRRPKLSPKLVARIARGLEQVHDGVAGDRAHPLRARLSF